MSFTLYGKRTGRRRTVVIDHKGNPFGTLTDMAEYYGIHQGTLSARLRTGWDLEKALTEPAGTHEKSIKDHLGNNFKSVAQMARHYNINYNVLKYRLSTELSIEQALMTPVEPSNYKYTPRNTVSISEREWVDHLGKKYSSRKAMAKSFGITDDALSYRLETGWELEKALTTPVHSYSQSELFSECISRGYISIKEMAEAHGISYTLLIMRIKRGLSINEALNMQVKQYAFKNVKDHKGNAYKSLRELAKAYNMSFGTLQSRLASGHTMEESLTKPYKKKVNN